MAYSQVRDLSKAARIFNRISQAPCTKDNASLLAPCADFTPYVLLEGLVGPALSFPGVSIDWFERILSASSVPLSKVSSSDFLQLCGEDLILDKTHPLDHPARRIELFWRKLIALTASCAALNPNEKWWNTKRGQTMRDICLKMFTLQTPPEQAKSVFASIWNASEMFSPWVRGEAAFHAAAFEVRFGCELVSPWALNTSGELTLALKDAPEKVMFVDGARPNERLYGIFASAEKMPPPPGVMGGLARTLLEKSPDLATACLMDFVKVPPRSEELAFFKDDIHHGTRDPSHVAFQESFVQACFEKANLSACQKFAKIFQSKNAPVPKVLAARIERDLIAKAVDGSLSDKPSVKPSKM